MSKPRNRSWDPTGVYDAVAAERARAHEKHGDSSIEAMHASDTRFLPALIEEVGEVAHSLTYDQVAASTAAGVVPLERTREELVQVAGVATAWADAIGRYLAVDVSDVDELDAREVTR